MAGLAEYAHASCVNYKCETYRRHSFNVEIMLRYFGKYAKRVSVTEPEESDFPDKQQRDGIGGEASVDVAVGGETSVAGQQAAVSTVRAVRRHQRTIQPGRSSGQRCRLSEYIMTIVDYLTSLFIKALKKTSNLHENSGTVEYFAASG